jgi:hypothetical protein
MSADNKLSINFYTSDITGSLVNEAVRGFSPVPIGFTSWCKSVGLVILNVYWSDVGRIVLINNKDDYPNGMPVGSTPHIEKHYLTTMTVCSEDGFEINSANAVYKENLTAYKELLNQLVKQTYLAELNTSILESRFKAGKPAYAVDVLTQTAFVYENERHSFLKNHAESLAKSEVVQDAICDRNG